MFNCYKAAQQLTAKSRPAEIGVEELKSFQTLKKDKQKNYMIDVSFDTFCSRPPFIKPASRGFYFKKSSDLLDLERENMLLAQLTNIGAILRWCLAQCGLNRHSLEALI